MSPIFSSGYRRSTWVSIRTTSGRSECLNALFARVRKISETLKVRYEQQPQEPGCALFPFASSGGEGRGEEAARSTSRGVRSCGTFSGSGELPGLLSGLASEPLAPLVPRGARRFAGTVFRAHLDDATVSNQEDLAKDQQRKGAACG